MDAVCFAALYKAEVRHDGANDAVLIQLTAALHIEAADCHDEVAVDDFAVFVHGKAAVGVAVKRDARVDLMHLHIFHKRFHMGGTAVIVDVRAVRLIMQHVHLGAELRKQCFRRHRGGAVRAVERDFKACQREVHRGLHVIDVIAQRVRRIRHRAEVAVCGQRRQSRFAEDQRLNALLKVVRQLVAVAAENFNAVILVRVV